MAIGDGTLREVEACGEVSVASLGMKCKHIPLKESAPLAVARAYRDMVISGGTAEEQDWVVLKFSWKAEAALEMFQKRQLVRNLASCGFTFARLLFSFFAFLEMV